MREPALTDMHVVLKKINIFLYSEGFAVCFDDM